MESNMSIQNRPINFFMADGHYISDTFNMQILDTSEPNAFENYDFTTIKPDMMDDYINKEKMPDDEQVEISKGIFDSIISFFSSPKEAQAV